MRKIKFRAWDNVANEMHFAGEDIDLIFQLGSEGIECTDIREMTSCGSCLGEMEHLIYMQFTGLKDKNGVEIYEGDIFFDDHNEEFGRVIFEEGKFLYETTTFVTDLFEIADALENRGNIYENAELLEADE